MFNLAILRYNFLICPFCAGSLVPSDNIKNEGPYPYGILTCQCSMYPIVAGIPVIKKGVVGAAGETIQHVTELVRSGRRREALLVMSRPQEKSRKRAGRDRLSSRFAGVRLVRRLLTRNTSKEWDESAKALLYQDEHDVTGAQLIDLYFTGGNRNSFDYFIFRFGQPRHLVALSLASILPASDKPILDLGCGFGHVTRGIQKQSGGSVVGIDNVFFLLYTAQLKIAPDASYVCCDANNALPFTDNSFSGVISTNTFHFIASKFACIRDLKRLTGDEGPIIFASLRHILSNTSVGNQALPIAGYQGLMGDMPNCLLSDSRILESYLHKQAPNLLENQDPEELSDESFISIVASRDTGLFRNHGILDDWCHAGSELHLNPLYEEHPFEDPHQILLSRKFPSEFYRNENKECESYLPEEVIIEAEVLDAIKTGASNKAVERLIEQMVVLDMPDDYLDKT